MNNIKNMIANMSNKSCDSTTIMDSEGSSSSRDLLKEKLTKQTKQTIEQTYQKKSQLEHILIRPDTYIGSVQKSNDLMWIYDTESQSMIQKQIEYVPGLYKIFDEILVNAADNKQRDKNMNCIKIDISPETNTISIWNNGKGIPVVMHKEEKMYVPTMIFGHLLTSSNYNDEEEKVTGGRNGYGAKLCNIFSTKFVVETASIEYKRQFKQIWANNMMKTSEPKIQDFYGDDFTKVTFSPDLSKFGMEHLDDDIVQLMTRRAYDVAASTRGVRVFLNGKRLPIKTFKDYVDLFIKGRNNDNDIKVVYEAPHERWEVAIAVSENGFQQMSFVNSIATIKGGKHVDYIVDMIVKEIKEVLKKRNKGGVNIKPFQIKHHMWVFINSLIVNPTFDSQTKENMTLQTKSFGSKCVLSEKFINQVMKCGLIDSILTWAKFKAQTELDKTSGKKHSKLKGIPKLEDANEAGTKNALKCTLILTEGDSAKALAVSGLSVIGRDHYGVFPLKGKLLNVREATFKQITENQEINNLIKIIGLQYKKKYNNEDDMKTLRYGKVMIMTDQDQDGSHIKGLIINFIHYNWPELLRQNFLEEFITPIVKATKKTEKLSFFSLPEYEEWRQNTPNSHTYHVKYYKGLGTSTSNEGKEYFSNMERHRISFRYSGQQDDDHIILAFSRKHAEHRKEWLTNFMVTSKRRKEMGLPDRYLYTKDTRFVTFTDFVNLELVLFSNTDNIRSIPSFVDGLKPGQRKVLYTCFLRNDKREFKVAQLVGSVSEKAAYHHGDAALCQTIIGLAQNFVGSNNINLLEPRGQFGTRASGGKDAASPRYIHTILSPITRCIFHPKDDYLLVHEYDDNQKVEPIWFIPIIPMLLVNGAEGIGTGWSTKITNYNPREIANNLLLMLNDEEPNNMLPWYKNFLGTVVDCGENRYIFNGEVSVISDNKIEITELPVGTWTQTYKENVLEPLLHGSEKLKAVISDYKEFNTDTTVKFNITLLPGQLENMKKEGLHKHFKLQTMVSTNTMNAFDELGCIRRFDNVIEILKEFFKIRLNYYQKRKDYFEGMLSAEADKLSYQARFIVEKCTGTLTVENKKRKTIIDELIRRGYKSDPVKKWKSLIKLQDEEQNDTPNDEEQNDDNDDNDDNTASSTSIINNKPNEEETNDIKQFDYLLGMSMWMLTDERKNELLRQKDEKLSELDLLKKKTKSDLWKEDLKIFLNKLDEIEKQEKEDEKNSVIVKTKNLKKIPGKKKILLKEILPSPAGKRIEPIVGDDLKRRIQTAIKLKESKVNKRIKKEITEIDEPDEFDDMIKNKKTIKDKLGTPEKIEKKVVKKDKLKQTKLTFKKLNGSPKKTNSSFSDDDDEDNDDNYEFGESPKVPERISARNKKKVLYTLSSDDDALNDDNDEVLFDNLAIKEQPIIQKTYNFSSDDDLSVPPPKLQESSEDMFDSLVGRKKPNNIELLIPDTKTETNGKRKKLYSSDSDIIVENETENNLTKLSKDKKKKTTATTIKVTNNIDGNKKKGRKLKKKPKNSDDNDDDDDFQPKLKSTKSTKKKIINSDENDISIIEPPKKRAGGRAKQTKYVFSDSDSN